MLKIVEIKETISDGDFIDNIYDSQNLIKKILNRIELSKELNYDEYKFLNIVMAKTRNNLEKAYQIIKI